MVLEFLQYGDLRNVLKGCTAKGIELQYAEQLSIACQVSERGAEGSSQRQKRP